MTSLAGKHFLVTGGSSGIGQAIVGRLLEADCQLTCIGRRLPEEISGRKNGEGIVCDLADQSTTSAVLKTFKQANRPLDGVILSHGYGAFGSIEEFSQEAISQLIQTNFTSVAMLARCTVPMLRQQASSDLLMIGSEAALKAGKKGAIYSATKFAVRGLAQALRHECQGSGVRVSVVNPGMVDTPFFDELSFSPGEDEENALTAASIADTVMHILRAPKNTVFDEINLSPLKSVIRNKTTRS